MTEVVKLDARPDVYRVAGKQFKKGIPTVQVSKKYFLKLSLNLVVMGILGLVASLAVQTTVSASSLKTPSTRPSVVKPNDSCDATGSGGCAVTFSGTLAGALSATIGSASITPPTTLNGVAQTVPFTFTTSVADTRGTAAGPWVLSAASPGLLVSTITGTATDPFVVTGVTAACTATASCSDAAIVPGTGSLSTTAGAYATAPSDSDLGTTTVSVAGTVSLGADTVGGAYAGTITVTAGPSV